MLIYYTSVVVVVVVGGTVVVVVVVAKAETKPQLGNVVPKPIQIKPFVSIYFCPINKGTTTVGGPSPVIALNVSFILISISSNEVKGSTSNAGRYSPPYITQVALTKMGQSGQISATRIIYKFNYKKLNNKWEK
jgi:hypothetical protein